MTAIDEEDSLSVGHVFCALSDLKQVACDAWLLPSSRDFVPDQNSFFSKTARPRQYAGTGASGLKYFGRQAALARYAIVLFLSVVTKALIRVRQSSRLAR